ncbi:MAG: hypothetical protein S4CHLAM20_04130 [Chlamydiia bacterium]|nr:hypothetical protein [Chlamydiia bacterium]
MSLLDRARKDWLRHTSGEDGFGVDITFHNQPSPFVVIRGIGMAHHMSEDTEGHVINTRNSHISFSEKLANDSGIITRNNKGEVDLEGVKISFLDSSNTLRKYSIKQVFPDETVGVIYCVLNSYEQN